VLDYTINPYVGCQHGCTYCYAQFIKRFTDHPEEWGEFVDIKVNAPNLLLKEVKRKRLGRVWISGVCDPYQPLEKKYMLTRQCLKILALVNWPITIQTKSPLVIRDWDILRKLRDVQVGITITTSDENIRKLFEPKTPSIKERIKTLEKLHNKEIMTFAMIAPMLPHAKNIISELTGKVDHVLIDRMNYHYAKQIYKKAKLEYALTSDFFNQEKKSIIEELTKYCIPYKILY
jgi:DNA repair photolyase